jgi:hypothetical protein
MNAVASEVQNATAQAAAAETPATLQYTNVFAFRAPTETRIELAQKAFPEYTGKPENILAWPRDKANQNVAGKKAYVEACKAAEEKHEATITIPNPETLSALVMNSANGIVLKTMNAARRKGEEIAVEYEFGIADLLEEAEDEEAVGSTRLSEEEQELYTSLVEEFVSFRRYKEVSAASYAIALIALNGKAKEMLHAIKNAQHFPKFHEAFGNWVDENQNDQRPLVERALKRQTRYQAKAEAEYKKIVGATAVDEIIA